MPVDNLASTTVLVDTCVRTPGQHKNDGVWAVAAPGVSPAFSAVRMREACRVVAECALDLVGIIAAKPEQPRNVDNLLLRESMDVIGELPQLCLQTDDHDDDCFQVQRPASLGLLVWDLFNFS